MDREKVIATLLDPSTVNQWSVTELQELVQSFPFFQPARLWLVKLLHEHQDHSYKDSLRFTASQCIDRTYLYDLIYKYPLRKQIEQLEDIVHELEQVAEKAVPDEKAPEEISEVTKTTDANIDDAIPITQLGARKDKHVDELEMEILKHAMASTVVLDDKVSENIPAHSVEEQTEEEVGKQSFSDWLVKLDGRPIEKRKNKKKNKELIDRFIAEKPQISKSGRGTFFKPSDIAKLSLVEHEDFVTETLAQVYEKQGNTPRAIKIYEQLILKYPKKKSYFAARILELKNSSKEEKA